jgi:hypothetical protein
MKAHADVDEWKVKALKLSDDRSLGAARVEAQKYDRSVTEQLKVARFEPHCVGHDVAMHPRIDAREVVHFLGPLAQLFERCSARCAEGVVLEEIIVVEQVDAFRWRLGRLIEDI